MSKIGRVRATRTAIHGYVFSLAGVGAAALASSWLDETLNTLNISLLYLFVVLVAATTYGYGPAIMASILGVLSFYFEFYPPYGLNSDLQPEDWLTLLFFLTFAVAISRLASAARSRAELAMARERELVILHHLGEALTGGDDVPALLDELARQVRITFDLSRCAILLPDESGALCERAVQGGDVSLTAWSAQIQLPFTDRHPGRLVLQRDTPLGDGDMRVLSTFAGQAAVAIERATLAADARAAAVWREADRLKTSLLRIVSHDLRTPLASIKARTSNLLEGDIRVEVAEWQESMRAIDAAADHLGRLVAKALELSRIEAGAVHPHLEPYTADEVISAVLPHVERAARQHRLALDVPDNLPPVYLDIILIGQVLTNLLENAFKYAPAGSTVHVVARMADSGLLVEVADHGPGIPPAVRDRIFDAFYRVNYQQQNGPQGSGLGLAICRGLVAAHGGWIQATETPKGGATFRFWLPVQPQKIKGLSGRQDEQPVRTQGTDPGQVTHCGAATYVEHGV